MKKTIMQTGNSLGLYFNKEEQRIYNLVKGEILEFEIKPLKKS